MARKKTPTVGSVTWLDLTVKDTARVRDFYSKVTGGKSSTLDMGGYDDFCMNQPGDAKAVAGIWHARGENAVLPPQWLIYITVRNLGASVRKCRALGGKVVVPSRKVGPDRMAVIKDPAGAVAALFQPA